MARIFVGEIFRQMKVWAKSQHLENARCGAVTFLQRFTKTLVVHPHLHVIVIGGVFTRDDDESEPEFHRCPPPTQRDLMEGARNVFLRMQRFLERHGFVGQDADDKEVTSLNRWYLNAQRGLAGREVPSAQEASVGEPSMLAPTKAVLPATSDVEHGGFHRCLTPGRRRTSVLEASVHAAVTVPA